MDDNRVNQDLRYNNRCSGHRHLSSMNPDMAVDDVNRNFSRTGGMGALDSHRVWNQVCSLSEKLRWLRNYAEDPAPSLPASKSIRLQIAAASSVR